MRHYFNPLLLSLILICQATYARQKDSSSLANKLRNGDIVFQYIPCGDLCIAIAETTPCAREHPFNHCGIIVKAGDSVSVLEAIGKNVHATPLSVFLKRDTATQLFVGRPRKNTGVDPDAAVRKAGSLAGKPYDDVFLPGDSALYCSELVFESYQREGRPVFALVPMTFKSPRSGQTFPAWTEYYRGLNRSIPEGLPGINPCAIANDPVIRLMVFPKGTL